MSQEKQITKMRRLQHRGRKGEQGKSNKPRTTTGGKVTLTPKGHWKGEGAHLHVAVVVLEEVLRGHQLAEGLRHEFLHGRNHGRPRRPPGWKTLRALLLVVGGCFLHSHLLKAVTTGNGSLRAPLGNPPPPSLFAAAVPGMVVCAKKPGTSKVRDFIQGFLCEGNSFFAKGNACPNRRAQAEDEGDLTLPLSDTIDVGLGGKWAQVIPVRWEGGFPNFHDQLFRHVFGRIR